MQIKRLYHPKRPDEGSTVSVLVVDGPATSPDEEERRWSVRRVHESMEGRKIRTTMVLEQIVDQSPAPEEQTDAVLVSA